jgi:hypothetical protein
LEVVSPNEVSDTAMLAARVGDAVHVLPLTLAVLLFSTRRAQMNLESRMRDNSEKEDHN